MEIFNNLCRACNTENPNLLNIFNNQQCEESVTVKNMLEYCLQTSMHNKAMYPSLICFFCVKQLEISYRFLKRFKLSQIEFEEAYKHIKGINENPEADIKDEEELQEIEGAGREDKLNNVCVFPPECFPKIKKNVKLNTTIGNIEPIMNIHLPTLKDEVKFSSLLPKTCSICHKTFLTAKAHNLHLRLTHRQCKNERNRNQTNSKIVYMADIKIFKTDTIKSNLNVQHIEPVNYVQKLEVSTKSDDMPGKQCSICNKPFFTTKALNLHLKLAHKQKTTLT